MYCLLQQPVARFSLATANTVLLSALEWGEVMIVKDTVTYFGRSAGGGAVRDLFLPDRSMVSHRQCGMHVLGCTAMCMPVAHVLHPVAFICVNILGSWLLAQ